MSAVSRTNEPVGETNGSCLMSDVETRPSTTIIGPSGRPLSLDSLPPADTRRWVARRKAEVVAAVRGGLLSFEEACTRYNLTPEEFSSWERAIDRHGLNGLRVTRLQEFRG